MTLLSFVPSLSFAINCIRITGNTRNDQLKCLTCNCYHEARGESMAGKEAVTRVLMNRVRDSRFPDTICEVTYEPRQFNWTFDGKANDTITGMEQWGNCTTVAENALNNVYPNLPRNFNYIFFLTTGSWRSQSSNAWWRRTCSTTTTIDNHKFCGVGDSPRASTSSGRNR